MKKEQIDSLIKEIAVMKMIGFHREIISFFQEGRVLVKATKKTQCSHSLLKVSNSSSMIQT